MYCICAMKAGKWNNAVWYMPAGAAEPFDCFFFFDSNIVIPRGKLIDFIIFSPLHYYTHLTEMTDAQTID